MKTLRCFLIAMLLSLSLTGCVTVPPKCIDNVCTIFQEYPDWYTAAKASECQWGVPVPVQMAIVHQESSFRCDARPPRRWILGFIPWTRPTTAYGYAQAVDGTWDLYQKKTGHRFARRSRFEDAIDFVGWYLHTAHCQLGIAPTNTYALYLAYHEGLQGYAQRRYMQKPWLMKVATKVGVRAKQYYSQLRFCSLPCN